MPKSDAISPGELYRTRRSGKASTAQTAASPNANVTTSTRHWTASPYESFGVHNCGGKLEYVDPKRKRNYVYVRAFGRSHGDRICRGVNDRPKT